ncbi:UNVERIFIED_ORG: succinate-semialdehyde dehydrogenase [Pseudomonas vranovensis]|nr:succinate-semialdehyde dehydrogenase [Pseudomonas vranovensis]
MTNISSLTHAISINPVNGEQIGNYPFESEAALQTALSRATAGFRVWRCTPVAQRAQRLIALANVLRNNAEMMVNMITLEMGKPITLLDHAG